MKKTPIKTMLLLLLTVLTVFATQPSSAPALTDEEFDSLSQSPDQVEQPQETEETEPPTVVGIIGRLSLSLGLVLGLMGGVLWVARRYFPQAIKNVGRGSSIDILASRALGQRRQLLMVRAKGKTVLLGVTPHSIQCLTEIDEEPEGWDDAASLAGLNATDPSPIEPPNTGTTNMGEF